MEAAEVMGVMVVTMAAMEVTTAATTAEMMEVMTAVMMGVTMEVTMEDGDGVMMGPSPPDSSAAQTLVSMP